MVRGILCELEGVIADTSPLRADALREAFEALGVAVPAGAAERHALGRSARDAAESLAADVGLDDATTVAIAALDADRRFAARVGHGALLASGAAGFVRSVRSAVPIAIVSRARRSVVDALLAMSGLSDDFAFVIASDDVVCAKPDAEGYRLALRRLARLGITAADVVALEDGVAGIAAAHAAGLRCVAVGAVPEEEAFAADAWMPPLANQELRSLIDLLNQRREERA